MTPVRTEFRLDYQPPYDWASMHAWLDARALPSIERVTNDGYARTARIGDACVLVDVTHDSRASAFDVVASADRDVDVDEVRARLVRVLDLDRDPIQASACVAADAWLSSLCDRHRGLRVPGGWDPCELACRAVLGQQGSVVAARQLVATLVRICGRPLPPGLSSDERARTFPEPVDVLTADLASLRMPGARKATLQALADAATAPGFFAPAADLASAIARLRGVKGIGDWTAHYIALRALRQPDAFPASDAGLLRGAADADGKPSPAALLARAESWRPHRAYAAQLLGADAESAASAATTMAIALVGRVRPVPAQTTSRES